MNIGIIDSAPKIISSGLVLHLDAAQKRSYPGTGTTWTDLSGNGNNGTLVNGPTFNSANGGSIVFDGVDDHINMGNILNSVFAGTNVKYTISVWVKFDVLNVNTGYSLVSKIGDSSFGENQRQFSFIVRNLTGSSYNGFQVEYIKYATLDAGSFRGVRTNNFNVLTNNIYNITVTHDGSINTNDGLDRVNLYLNSVNETKTISFTGGTLLNTFEAGTARTAIGSVIGANPINTPRSPLDGNVYNTLIYNRVLSQAEILQNYNATKSRFGL
jgi:hypothetical protein